MEVILLDKIGRLGGLGDKVKVRNGYARNYLLPLKKAVLATKENLAKFEAERAQLEAKIAAELKAAQDRAEKLAAIGKFVITAQAGDEGKLFGSLVLVISQKQLSKLVLIFTSQKFVYQMAFYVQLVISISNFSFTQMLRQLLLFQSYQRNNN